MDIISLKDSLNIVLRQTLKVFILITLFAIVVPYILGMLLDIQMGAILSLVTSTFILQAAASPLGLRFGLDPAVVLTIMTSFAIGITLGILEICDTFSETSEGVQRWLTKVETKMNKITLVHRYGVVSCIFIAWIPGIGLFGTPVVAWLFGWNKLSTVVFTCCGFFLASMIMLLMAIGIISI